MEKLDAQVCKYVKQELASFKGAVESVKTACSDSVVDSQASTPRPHHGEVLGTCKEMASAMMAMAEATKNRDSSKTEGEDKNRPGQRSIIQIRPVIDWPHLADADRNVRRFWK